MLRPDPLTTTDFGRQMRKRARQSLIAWALFVVYGAAFALFADVPAWLAVVVALLLLVPLAVWNAKPFHRYLQRRAKARVREIFCTLSSLDDDAKRRLLPRALALENRCVRAEARAMWVYYSIGLALALGYALLLLESGPAIFAGALLIIGGPYLGQAILRWVIAPMDADARVFDGLINLLTLLQLNRARYHDPEFKREILKRLEKLARNVRYLLLRQIRTRDSRTKSLLRGHSLQVAGGFRELKLLVALPGGDSASTLTTRLAQSLTHVATGEWGLLDAPAVKGPSRFRFYAFSATKILVAVAAILAVLLLPQTNLIKDENLESGIRGGLASLAIGALVRLYETGLSRPALRSSDSQGAG